MEKNDEEQILSSFDPSNNLILSDLDKEYLKKRFKTIKSHIKKELKSLNIKINENDLDKDIINSIINEIKSLKKI